MRHQWSVRWLVVVAASVVTFVLCLRLTSLASIEWLPKAEEARWGVLVALASVLAGAVGGAAGWWAAQDGATPPRGGQRVSQEAEAIGRAQVTQVAGHAGVNGPAADRELPREVNQGAKASGDARIMQIGAGHAAQSGRSDGR